ncbi:MAG: zf-HC2 domain-containing protein, partial [Armatimonadota bacterium]
MNDIREDLKAYLDGELSPERAEEVRLALLQDEDLRQEYEFMKLLTKEIQSSAKEHGVTGEEVVTVKIAPKPRGWGWKQWSMAA